MHRPKVSTSHATARERAAVCLRTSHVCVTTRAAPFRVGHMVRQRWCAPAVLFLTAVLSARSGAQDPLTQEGLARARTMVPLTSASAAAKQHLLLGVRAADIGDVPAARAHLGE